MYVLCLVIIIQCITDHVDAIITGAVGAALVRGARINVLPRVEAYESNSQKLKCLNHPAATMDDNSQPDTSTPAPEQILEFHFPYRPSNLLYCALIIGVVLSLLAESTGLAPWQSAFFALTTYAPTIHFALQCIVQACRGSYKMADSDKAGKRAATLLVIWILTIIAHIYFWWNDRGWFSVIYLLPMFPGSQATLILLYIALRSAWDRHIIQSLELRNSAHPE